MSKDEPGRLGRWNAAVAFFTYMLRCSDGRYYVGHTENIELRVAQHNRGELPGYTKNQRPVELVWSQDFGTRIEALSCERRIKGWNRKKKEALIRGDWSEISRLSKGIKRGSD